MFARTEMTPVFVQPDQFGSLKVPSGGCLWGLPFGDAFWVHSVSPTGAGAMQSGGV